MIGSASTAGHFRRGLGRVFGAVVLAAPLLGGCVVLQSGAAAPVSAAPVAPVMGPAALIELLAEAPDGAQQIVADDDGQPLMVVTLLRSYPSALGQHCRLVRATDPAADAVREDEKLFCLHSNGRWTVVRRLTDPAAIAVGEVTP